MDLNNINMNLDEVIEELDNEVYYFDEIYSEEEIDTLDLMEWKYGNDVNRFYQEK